MFEWHQAASHPLEELRWLQAAGEEVRLVVARTSGSVQESGSEAKNAERSCFIGARQIPIERE